MYLSNIFPKVLPSLSGLFVSQQGLVSFILFSATCKPCPVWEHVPASGKLISTLNPADLSVSSRKLDDVFNNTFLG